ncbi:MAG: substrate-binding domain-containing protein [Kiritimatiellae bacterium]|nr:substrate-binding domain-containing protein [Kiritimatiellia bacterium]
MRKTVLVFLDLHMGFSREILRGLSHFLHTAPDWELKLLSYTCDMNPAFLEVHPALALVAPLSQAASTRVFLDRSRQLFPGHVLGVSTLDPFMPVPRILSDSRQAGRLAAEYFLQKGYRHFGYVPDGLNPTHWGSTLRESGFRERLKQAGHSVEVMPLGDLHATRSKRKFPLALFCFNDLTARQAISLLHASGTAIPEEVAVLGVDNDPLESALSPVPVSSVITDWFHVGVMAGRYLTHKTKEQLFVKQSIHWVPCLGVQTRSSTDALVSEDPVLQKTMRIITSQISELRTVNDCAAAVGASRRSLEMKVKNLTGHTVYELMSLSRLQLAKQLLQYPEIPISEVAERAGYADSRMLGLAFRRHENETPGQFRRRARPTERP